MIQPITPQNDDITTTLRWLGTKDLNVSLSAIRALRSYFRYNDDVRAEMAKTKMFESQGLASIMYSLERFQDSAEFVEETLFVLVALTYREHKFQKALIDLGMVDSLIFLVYNKHSDSYSSRANLVGLLYNLCRGHPHESLQLMNDDCMSYVVRTMKKYPKDAYVNKVGCWYMNAGIMISPYTKDLLVQKDIIPLMANVYNTFQKNYDRESGEVVDIAKTVMKQLLEDS